MENRFDPNQFVRTEIQEIRDVVKEGKVLLCCSGGVCSNVMATLFRKTAEQPNVTSVLIDTGFLREKEVETVSEMLSRAPMKLNLQVVDARRKFMKAVEQSETGIEKRKAFCEVFYATLSELAEREQAEFVALGTSATPKASTSQIPQLSSINKPRSDSVKRFEPLASLDRCQVKQVAEALDLPPRLSDLVPFPSMGLLIRAIGRISDEKIRTAREATSVVEDELQHIRPSQYFAAVLDNKDDNYEKIDKVREKVSDLFDVAPSQVDIVIPQSRVSALVDKTRVYLRASAARVTLLGSKETLEPDYDDLSNFPIEFNEKYKDFARCLYSVTRKPKNGKYIVVVRAVSTEDFSKAIIAKLEWSKLYSIAERIMDECSKVASVYYDVTPKPPATIELE
ncbi:MAG: phosphoadenosine phosphosulfate reductase family protein [Promethearchaeati archaeon SRVP18_Atabeyarchaeia-1]